jgi:hypothetical protein
MGSRPVKGRYPFRERVVAEASRESGDLFGSIPDRQHLLA